MITQDDHDRLKEIQIQMLEMLEEAKGIVKHSDNPSLYERFKAYGYPSIQMALTDEHMYCGSCQCGLHDVISVLEDDIESEDADEDDIAFDGDILDKV